MVRRDAPRRRTAGRRWPGECGARRRHRDTAESVVKADQLADLVPLGTTTSRAAQSLRAVASGLDLLGVR
jgi:hypothetical protein